MWVIVWLVTSPAGCAALAVFFVPTSQGFGKSSSISGKLIPAACLSKTCRFVDAFFAFFRPSRFFSCSLAVVRELGLLHVQIQTWFPLRMQVFVNGHDGLARKLDSAGIKYTQCDNVLVWIEDVDSSPRFPARAGGEFPRTDCG